MKINDIRFLMIYNIGIGIVIGIQIYLIKNNTDILVNMIMITINIVMLTLFNKPLFKRGIVLQ